MDTRSKELARLSSDIFHREVSPGYLEVREQLLGQLSVRGLAFEGVREEAAQRKSNYALLQTFVAALPKRVCREGDLNRYGDNFEARELATVHAIQKSVVWVAFSASNEKSMAGSYYVIGSLTDVDGKSTLLLFGTESEPDIPTRMTRVTSSTVKIKAILSLLNPYETAVDEETIKSNLYDPTHDVLKLSASSPGSIFISQGFLPRGGTRFPVWFKGIERGLLGITDQEWADYNVPDHLNQLAMLFDKKQLLDTALFR